jgi:two-component system sensor histidine kinase RpfC
MRMADWRLKTEWRPRLDILRRRSRKAGVRWRRRPNAACGAADDGEAR